MHLRFDRSALYVRLPVRPIQSATGLFGSDDMVGEIRAALEPYLDAALLVASQPLHGRLDAFASGAMNDAEIKRYALSILSYLARMAFRATPFGLFAGVAVVDVGERTSLRVDDPAYRVASRPDSRWMRQLVRGVELLAFDSGELHLVTNDLIMERGSRLYLIHQGTVDDPAHMGKADVVLRTIERTPGTDLVVEAASSPSAVASLVDRLRQALQVTDEEATAFVRSLWKSGFVESECLFDPTHEPIRTAAAFVHRSGREISKQLQTVERCCDDINSSSSEYGIARSIARAATSLATTGEPIDKVLQIDLLAKCSGSLGSNVIATVAEYGDLLLRASRHFKATKYRELFREVFEGHERLVPLLEFAEASLAIRSDQPFTVDGTDAQRPGVLAGILARAQCKNSVEVSLSDDEMRQLYPALPADAVLPASVEIGFHVLAEGPAEIDTGNFRIRPSGLFSQAKHSSMARFADALQRDIRCDESDEGLEAELVYEPLHTRMINVIARPASTRYEIGSRRNGNGTGDGNVRIPFSDVFVGMDTGGALFAWSKTLGRRLLVRQTHMLNWIALAPPVAHCLAVVGGDGRRVLGNFDWSGFETIPFRPRIVSGRLILSPAIWRLGRVDIRNLTNISVQDFRASLHVPRYVSIRDGDNKLLIDLESGWGRDLLLAHGDQKNPYIAVEEAAPQPAEAWLPSGSGTFAAEFVAGFDVVGRPADARLEAPAWFDGCTARIASPNSDWLYLQIFVGREAADTLLRTALRQVIATAQPNLWFFLRYGAVDPHVRLRLRGLASDARDRMLQAMDRLTQSGQIRKYTIASYEREIERYGGSEALPEYERLFNLSSEWALGSIVRKKTKEQRIERCVGEALALARTLLPQPELESLLGVLRRRTERSRAGQTDRAILAHVRQLPDLEAETAATIADVAARLRRLSIAGRSSRTTVDVFPSLLHLHCNRLGILELDERRVQALFTKALYSSTQRVSEVALGHMG